MLDEGDVQLTRRQHTTNDTSSIATAVNTTTSSSYSPAINTFATGTTKAKGRTENIDGEVELNHNTVCSHVVKKAYQQYLRNNSE